MWRAAGGVPVPHEYVQRPAGGVARRVRGWLMADVVLENIHKTYGNSFHAIKDLNLTIRDGEFLILVGPSGCGKSTALRMIAGLEEISSGNLRIGGVDVVDMRPKDRDIAMVFQSYALYPHMTVFDNIAFSMRLAGKSRAERKKRVAEIAETLQLTPLLNNKPANLSGGQRQRVAMGRAMIREPAAFLMDEPLSNWTPSCAFRCAPKSPAFSGNWG